MHPSVIMNEEAIHRTLDRMAHEIVERYIHELNASIFVGIRTRGVPLSHRLTRRLERIIGMRPITGVLDITLYRDDLTQIGPAPLVRKTELPMQSIQNYSIFLVDDVLYTGRTVRAALDALIDFGRPQSVRLVVLIDRNHRELPIQADIVGRFVPTSREQIVHVMLRETDGKDEILLLPGVKHSEGADKNRKEENGESF